MSCDVALVVGHRQSSQGAAGNGITEFGFWSQHVQTLAGMLGEANLAVAVVHREDHSDGYARLPRRVLDLAPRLAVSFHLNSFHLPTATGSEVLYAARDDADLRLCRALQEAQVDALDLADRGVKPIPRGHRGGPLLWSLYDTPCGIVEPAFVSNETDVRTLQEQIDSLLLGYANVIREAQSWFPARAA